MKRPLPPALRQSVLRMMPLGPVEARPMFGGYGVFLDGLMFGLFAGEVLYFKTDPDSEARFRAAGSEPFTFRRKGRTVAMSYWRAPEACGSDPDALLEWARTGNEAARRAAARKPVKKEKKGR